MSGKKVWWLSGVAISTNFNGIETKTRIATNVVEGVTATGELTYVVEKDYVDKLEHANKVLVEALDLAMGQCGVPHIENVPRLVLATLKAGKAQAARHFTDT